MTSYKCMYKIRTQLHLEIYVKGFSEFSGLCDYTHTHTHMIVSHSAIPVFN